MMRGDISKNICEFMNARCNKKFNLYQISCIRNSIQKEYKDRRKNEIKIRSYSRQGKLEINKRVAKIAMEHFSTYIAPEDVKIFKDCWRQEYEERKGKCTWGIPKVREKQGYDPNTGYEREVDLDG